MSKYAILTLWMFALTAAIAAAQTNTFPPTGSVGIGTTSPGQLLEVNGNTQLDGILQVGNGTGPVSLTLEDVTGSTWSMTTNNSHLEFQGSSGNPLLTLCDTNAVCSGRVGIGTASPSAGLDIEQNSDPATGGASMGLKVNNTITANTTDYPQNYLQTLYSGTGIITQPSIYGLASEVIESGAGPITNAFAGWFRVTNSYATGSITNGFGVYVTQPDISQPNGSNSVTHAYGLYIGAQQVTGVSTGYGIDQVGPNDINTLAGKVGVGTTTTPGKQLDVSGTIRTSANTSTGDPGGIVLPDGTTQTTAWTGVLCGGDYAEAVDASGDLKHYGPGDVLVLGSGDDGEVEKSSEPYSSMVTGIFATKPGVIGRRETLSKSAQEIPMAMVGIVPTRVSAENGPIHRGDLLVSSSTPGFAMKGTDRNRMLGAVIGKAMGTLDSGTGVIEVVVTLQ